MHGLRPELAFEPASGSRSLPPTRWRSTVAERPLAEQGFHLICDEPKVRGRWVVYPGRDRYRPDARTQVIPFTEAARTDFQWAPGSRDSPLGSRDLQAQSRVPERILQENLPPPSSLSHLQICQSGL